MKKFFRRLAAFILVVIVITNILNFLESQDGFSEYFESNRCKEYSVLDSISYNVHHYRSWNDVNNNKQYCKDYKSYSKSKKESERIRNSISVQAYDYLDYWKKVYGNLAEADSRRVQFLADSLYSIGVKKQLDKSGLASLIVSFVQDIPYSYILQEDCEEEIDAPCYDQIRFGIYTPYEFLHTLHGDCDTRALLLYAIFDHLEYDPMILISQQYQHAILAMNLPGSGVHVNYHRKKYFLWETTAKGWKLGMVSPELKNINYWKIALVK